MSITTNGERISVPEAPEVEPTYEACDQCSAPVDTAQRYCVVCGTRRKHAYDPAAQFLSRATSRKRSGERQARSAPARKRRSFSLATAAVLVAIPLAVAVGVLVGRAGNGTDSKLLAAIKAQQPTVVNVGGGTGSDTSTSGSAVPTAAVTPVSSDFTLQRGFTVQLQTISATGVTQADVTAAEKKAKAKGATAVGLITHTGFHLTPSPPAGDDVIYSGQYKTKAAATAALTKLKHRFPGAKVIAVQSSTAAAASTKVLSKTNYGSAHAVTGFKPSASQLATGGQVAAKTAKELNGNYVKSQQGLPDQVSIP
jgi:hypothetical protein